MGGVQEGLSGGLEGSARCPFMLIAQMKLSSGSSKRRLSNRGLGGVLREQRAKLYIIRRCVVMLLCWHD
ncbi:hypothetical protein GQ457_15G005370 [Hibiscus cannabinus]